jgi:hypothetical protein
VAIIATPTVSNRLAHDYRDTHFQKLESVLRIEYAPPRALGNQLPVIISRLSVILLYKREIERSIFLEEQDLRSIADVADSLVVMPNEWQYGRLQTPQPS